MSNKSVLIAYGSRYGSTEEISHEIAKVFESEGLTARLTDTMSGTWFEERRDVVICRLG
jgi:menaquinone-dependent protoporphyrinogen IX oxidase